MLALLKWLWNGIRKVVGLVLPVFAKAKDFQGWGTGLRWFVHIVLVAGVVVGLWFLDPFVASWVHSGPDFLRAHFLTVTFGIVYALAWVLWWIWKLFQEEEIKDYPDIDADWEEAKQALARAGLDLTQLPIFLVLGRPASSEEDLFKAAGLKLDVAHVPNRPDAALRVYANRDALYITCGGKSSQVGWLTAALVGDKPGRVPAPVWSADDPMGQSMVVGDAEDALKTIGGQSQAIPDARALMALLEEARREGRDVTREDRAGMRQLAVDRPALGEGEAARLTSRLTYLCRLIEHDRRPWCPINGLLWLIPLGATDTDKDATDMAQAARQDLLAIRKTCRLHFPMLGMLCDMERAPGFKHWLQRYSETQRQQRLGQGFPYVPDLGAAAAQASSDGVLSERLRDFVHWLCSMVLRRRVDEKLRLEVPGKMGLDDVISDNLQPFRVLAELTDRQDRLARIVSRGVAVETGGPPMFGGLYLAATGASAAEQGFVAGVFHKLSKDQSKLCWTDEAMAADASAHRWATNILIASGIGVVAIVAAVVWVALRGHIGS
ncbi:MAG TPA: type VI secretion protein IcmF/TssM N-terminal domain-containing protein [Gemmataceae bacterium]|nr:type VI secretion protein IcmF/TssM N-terminal domain-containing protein [Gemmataceae bacterium]